MPRETIKKVVNRVDHLDHDNDRQIPKIYTSYYSNPLLREISHDKLTKISISLYPPKGWIEKGGLHYYPLCPSPEIFRHVKSTGDHKTYVKELLEQFNNYDARFIYDALMEMSGGNPVCLLCFETPIPTVGNYVYCHRQIVAQWLSSELGIVVPELTSKHVQDFLNSNDELSLF